MEALTHLLAGIGTVLEPANLLAALIGLVLGMLVAVLPGLTLMIGVVLALPFTYKMGVTPALVLLSAMYMSGSYAGAITSILFRIPGEPMDVPLLWDGYEMTKRGEAAQALGWSLIAALVGGAVAVGFMVTVAEPVARFALRFSSPEFFAIVVLGLASVLALSTASVVNGLISLCLGLLIGTVGADATYGAQRFSLDQPFLMDGIDFLLVMVGIYGIGEVISRLHTGSDIPAQGPGRFRTALPRLGEMVRKRATFLRATLTGVIVGVVPGAGATVSAFVAYGLEGQYGKVGRSLGSGTAEGIIAAKSSATASVGGALVPLLALGIPGSGVTAIMLAAFLLHGVQPGPQVFATSPQLIYAIFGAIAVALVGMGILGYLAIKPLCKILDAPEALVSGFILVFCFIGAFAARNSINDLYLVGIFGLVGYAMERYRFPVAPMILGTILGPLAETNFVTAMISFDNDWTIFFTRPISGSVMALVAVSLLFPLWRNRKSRRLGMV